MKAEKSSSLLRSFVGHTVLAIAVLPVVLISFQNCAPKAFDAGVPAGEPGVEIPQGTCEPPNPCGGGVDPTGNFALVDHVIRTEINTPKEWTAPNNGDKSKHHISLGLDTALTSVTLPNQGRIDILDAVAFTLRFTPEPGFRGNIQFWLYGNSSTEKTASQAQVTIQVGNSLNFFQPVLAVRASGCVMCHADVRSNIATDFGYGNSYYFGQNVNYMSWKFGAIYGDHQAFESATDASGSPGNWTELMHVADKKVYVPANAAIPVTEAKNLSGASTLAGYLTQRLAASIYAGTKAANKVVERSTLYIGAPTASRLKTVFAWDASQGNLIYKKDSVAGAFDLAGLSVAGNYYTNNGSLVCEGDVFINGTLYLNDLSVRTRTGCRLYVTGSVFVYGPINYENITNSDNRNLQITSSSAILMGLGSMYDGSNHCEQGLAQHNWYYKRKMEPNYSNETHDLTAAQKIQHDKAIADSAYMRLSYFWTNTNNHMRSGGDPVANGTAIYNEMINTIGLPKDAACYIGGRGVSYSRLLLNAPRVESRYNGNFLGSIIAETNVMALGQFKFEFDEVFNRVQILPKLQDSDYLKVE